MATPLKPEPSGMIRLQMLEPLATSSDTPDKIYQGRLLPLGVYEWGYEEYGNEEYVTRLTIDAALIAEMQLNFDSRVLERDIPLVVSHWEDEEGACGWIRELTVAEDGLYFTLEATDRGEELIQEKRFKYVSACYWPTWKHPRTKVEYHNVLWEVTLTNFPRLPKAELLAFSETGKAYLWRTEQSHLPPKKETEPMTEEEKQALQRLSEQVSALTGELQALRTETQTAQAQREESDRVQALSAEILTWRTDRGEVVAPAVALTYAQLLAKLPEDQRTAQLTALKAHPPGLVAGAPVVLGGENSAGELSFTDRKYAEELGISSEDLQKYGKEA